MRNVGRKLAFVLASSNHGTMIVNRMDYRMVAPDPGYGVGFQISKAAPSIRPKWRWRFNCSKRAGGITATVWSRSMRRQYRRAYGRVGDGDDRLGQRTGGRGAGTRLLALAGNIAINNCFNAIAIHAAVSSEAGSMKIPSPNYLTASSFGSLELRQSERNEFIGQAVDYAENTVDIRKMTIDMLNFPRVDLIKMDVEGMELEALEGGRKTIETCRPIILVESIKAGRDRLRPWLEAQGYKVIEAGIDLLAIHASDKTLSATSTRNTSRRRPPLKISQAVELGDTPGHFGGRFVVGLGFEGQRLARGRPLRQRISHAFKFGTTDKSMSTARLMTAATLRSATVSSSPSR